MSLDKRAVELICLRVTEGLTYAEAGLRLGVSRTRANQIVSWTLLQAFGDDTKQVKAAINNAAKRARQARKAVDDKAIT